MEVQANFDDHGLIAKYQATPKLLDTATRMAMRKVQAEIIREVVGREGLSKYSHRTKAAKASHRAGRASEGYAGTWSTPSPPGEPPAMLSGTLFQSVKSSVNRHKPVRVGFGTYSIAVSPDTAYARIQELGGSTGTATLPARPYMAPAVARIRANGRAVRIFMDEVERQLKRHA